MALRGSDPSVQPLLHGVIHRLLSVLLASFLSIQALRLSIIHCSRTDGSKICKSSPGKTKRLTRHNKRSAACRVARCHSVVEVRAVRKTIWSGCDVATVLLRSSVRFLSSLFMETSIHSIYSLFMAQRFKCLWTTYGP